MVQVSRARSDCTEWVIHFIHQRCAPAIDASRPVLDQIGKSPLAFSETGRPIWPEPATAWRQVDNAIDSASSFEVLKDIVRDGFIRPSWSFRKGCATVYGPSPAVCFTEMPLHALITYVEDRKNLNLVDRYCIGVLKRELYALGGRPVIYGLSGEHKETKESDCTCTAHYRELHPDCGIGVWEQYRYVYTNMGSNQKPVNWTHEREWRWPYRPDVAPRMRCLDIHGNPHSFTVEGLPLWLEQGRNRFSKIVLVVERDAECAGITSLLRTYLDGESAAFSFPRSKEMIENTFVISIEGLASTGKALQGCRIEDIPCRSMPRVQASSSVLSLVRASVEAAKATANRIAQSLRSTYGSPDVFQLAGVITYVDNSEVTDALRQLGHVQVIGGLGYLIPAVAGTLAIKVVNGHYLEAAAAAAAATELSQRLGQRFETIEALQIESQSVLSVFDS